MNHPNKVDRSWHEREFIFWEVQNRQGVPGFYADRHSLKLFDSDFSKEVQVRTKTEYAIYVRAYDFGKYPEVYKAMEDAGAELVSLEEAEALIESGQTIQNVPGAKDTQSYNKEDGELKRSWWKFW